MTAFNDDPLFNELVSLVSPALLSEFRHSLQTLQESSTEELHARLSGMDQSRKQAWARVWSLSPFIAEYCARHPDFFVELLGSDRYLVSKSEEDFRRQLQSMVDQVADEAALMSVLRRFRQQQMCRIIWRDFTRQAEMDETVRDMSHLADTCIDIALTWIYNDCCKTLGTPMGLNPDGNKVQQYMSVIGMGKLGAHELNVSSDIDLIFTFALKGETEGARRTLENQAFFIRVGQRLINVLDRVTGEGFVFRVDMRLRPYGQSGALALSFAAMEEYYQDQGREWERYAMVKARIVAGDKEQGAKLMSALHPFVFRKYIDFGVIESLRDMKMMIAREVRRKGMEDNIKLGDGGIREIEFVAQAFQLVRGGRDLNLRTRELRQVFGALVENGLMPEEAVNELRDAYCFLRNVEHAVQGIRDQQTQMLPADEVNRLRVALVMGFNDWGEFINQLSKHRASVSLHFAEVITEDGENSEAAKRQHEECWKLIWSGEYDDHRCEEIFIEHGLPDPARLVGLLGKMRASKPVLMMQTQSRERLDRFMPILLESITRIDNAGVTLERVLMLVESVLRRTSYLVLLYENPNALEQLVKLCSVSPWIAEQLSSTPLLLDELLNTETLYTPPRKWELSDELNQQLLRIPEEDMEELMEVLRLFKKAHVLRVAASELAGTLPLMKVSDYLTWIAEAMLDKVVQIAWKMMVDKHGYPQKAPGVPCELDFLVLGYGKVGGIELGYSSDLDLVFIHDVPTHLSTDGERSIDNAVFFIRLGQKIIHILNARMSSGQLYEVDMRLRPSGNSGLLVTTLQSFEKYQENDAWTWEHQALVRARPVAGSDELADRFQAVRSRIIARQRDRDKLREDVKNMRDKMRDNLGTKVIEGEAPKVFHIKHDAGGIVDIEFIVQFCVLAYSHEYPALCKWSDNVRLLEEIGRAGILTVEKTEQLKEAYITLRSMIHKRALQNESSRVDFGAVPNERKLITEVWNALFS